MYGGGWRRLPRIIRRKHQDMGRVVHINRHVEKATIALGQALKECRGLPAEYVPAARSVKHNRRIEFPIRVPQRACNLARD